MIASAITLGLALRECLSAPPTLSACAPRRMTLVWGAVGAFQRGRDWLFRSRVDRRRVGWRLCGVGSLLLDDSGRARENAGRVFIYD